MSTNNVTDLSTSKQLVPIMVGVDAFFTWQRRMDMFGKWGKWCLRYPGTYQHCNVDNPYKVESQDAYTLDDLLSRLPATISREWTRMDAKLTTTYTRILTADSVQYTYLVNTLNHIKGSLIFFGEQDKIKNATQACANLLLWLSEHGYLREEENDET